MENFSGLPPDFRNKLKCFVCNNYLSYFPISICSNDQSCCGRCTVPDGLLSFHNEVFEAFSQYIKFPCRYKSEGCCEELVPNEIPQHEDHQCLFRVVECLIRQPNTCTWKGSPATLLQHCIDDHNDLFLKDGEFFIDLADNKEYNHVFQHQEKVYIVSTKLDTGSKTLHFSVYNNEPYRSILSTKCKLSLEKDNIKLFFDFETCGYTNMVFNKLNLTSLTDGENNVEVRGKIYVGDEVNSKIENDKPCEDADVDEDKARSEATFRYIVKEISRLTDYDLSPVFHVRNLPWRIMVMPRSSEGQDGTAKRSLGFFLQCNKESESRSWSCYAVADLRVLSVRPDVRSFSRKIEHLFCYKEFDWGFTHFMPWNDVLDPETGYIKDDAITVEVHVVADAPNGDARDNRKRASGSTRPSRTKKNREK